MFPFNNFMTYFQFSFQKILHFFVLWKSALSFMERIINLTHNKKKKKNRKINFSFFYIYILHKKIIYPDADGKKKEFTKRYTFFLL